jgi:hypothetical protein
MNERLEKKSVSKHEKETSALKESIGFAIKTACFIALQIGLQSVKPQKTKIYDPLVENKTSYSQTLSFQKYNQNIPKGLQLLNISQDDFESKIKELEDFAETKIYFPQDMKYVDNRSLTSLHFVDLNKIESVSLTVGLYNAVLPEKSKIQSVAFVDKINSPDLKPGEIIEGVFISESGDMVIINNSTHTTIIHEIHHILSQGLTFDNNELGTQGITDLSKFIGNGKNFEELKKLHDIDLMKFGLRRYSFDESNSEIYTTMCELLSRDYELLSDSEQKQYDKCLAFAATKQTVFGTQEFKNILQKLTYLRSSNNFSGFSDEIPQQINILKHKIETGNLNQNPDLKNYLNDLESMKQKHFFERYSIEAIQYFLIALFSVSGAISIYRIIPDESTEQKLQTLRQSQTSTHVNSV